MPRPRRINREESSDSATISLSEIAVTATSIDVVDLSPPNDAANSSVAPVNTTTGSAIAPPENMPEGRGILGESYVDKVSNYLKKIRYEYNQQPPPENPIRYPYHISRPYFEVLATTSQPSTYNRGIMIPTANGQVNWDMLLEFHQLPSSLRNSGYAELKGYREQSAINTLPTKYREFLEKCYNSVEHLERTNRGGYKFYFIASAPFSTSHWDRLKSPSYIQEQLASILPDDTAINQDWVSLIANNIKIFIITWDMLERVGDDVAPI